MDRSYVLERVDRMLELVPRLPIMLVATCRPDFDAPWNAGGRGAHAC